MSRIRTLEQLRHALTAMLVCGLLAGLGITLVAIGVARHWPADLLLGLGMLTAGPLLLAVAIDGAIRECLASLRRELGSRAPSQITHRAAGAHSPRTLLVVGPLSFPRYSRPEERN